MPVTIARRPAGGTGDPVRIGTDTLEWPVWSTTARIVVTEPDRLEEAHAVVSEVLAEVDAAASRFRTDSEINQVHAAGGRPVEVSPLLAELVRAGLDAARRTDGDVDPTLGAALISLGYDRDLADLDRDVTGLHLLSSPEPTGAGPTRPQPTALQPAAAEPAAAQPTGGAGGFSRICVHRTPSWRQVELTGRRLTVPADTVLDLGATAKAWAADRAAALVVDLLGTGVLVSLGGDIATAGPGPDGGWQIRVQDTPDEPRCDIGLTPGAGIATSSTVRRQWRHGEHAVHHILNPRTLQPAEPVWRTVTVAAASCVESNTLTTAAMVRGESAWSWLNGLGVPARLVRHDGLVLATRTWPEPIRTTPVEGLR
ncbi:MAG TPA: FAD:protein FMN transferase [Kineosporiaceae bacterium]|nr:FAD:protein FMN transferase [Kineosporiaceae bacterium]